MSCIRELGLVLGVWLVALPGVAHALTVECTNASGTCEVTNDPFSTASCSRDDGSGDVAGGGDSWDGFTEELLEVCFDHLALCGEPSGSTSSAMDTGVMDTGVTITGVVDTGETTVGGSSAATIGGSGEDTGLDTGGNDGLDDASSAGDTATPSDSDATTSGGASGASTGDPIDPSTSGGASSPGDAGSPPDASDGADAATDDAGAADDAEGRGCSCAAERADGGASSFGFAIAVLLGWRARRRRA